jgi:hypothetical protein
MEKTEALLVLDGTANNITVPKISLSPATIVFSNTTNSTSLDTWNTVQGVNVRVEDDDYDMDSMQFIIRLKTVVS